MTERTSLEARADELYAERYDANARRTDRMFGYLMVVQWIAGIVVAFVFSPYGWAGKVRSVHVHVPVAIFIGGALSGVPFLLSRVRPGWVGTRYTIAIAQMLWSGLLIHLSGGRIETHFHVFGSLAFLAFYRDWRVLMPATIIVATDHLVRQMFWPESVYGVTNPEWWRFIEHAFWVVFEDAILVIGTLTGIGEMRKIAEQNAQVELTERAAKELEIAATIQASILPAVVQVPGLEAAARMLPADEVGGDYYDVLPVPNGCWIAIGDVAGHGVRAGLTMLQAQSALAALVKQAPNARPRELWALLNSTFYDNVRTRMRHDEHMTMSLLRYHEDGRIEVVGAHEEIVIWRAATNTAELVPLTGTWVGIARSIKTVEEQHLQLHPGDVLVLYTDGIIEARDRASGRMVGIEALRDSVAANHAHTVDEIRDAIFALTATAIRDDDASVLVFRYVGRSAAAAA